MLTILNNILNLRRFGQLMKLRGERMTYRYLKSLSQAIGMFVWTIDKGGMIEFIESKAPIEEILRAFTKESAQRLRDAIYNSDRSKPVEVEVEIDKRFQFKARHLRFYIYWNNEPDSQFTAFGKAIGIDEYKQQQEEIIAAYKEEEQVALKESFLASMGHEIRTPLNAIVGFLQMIVSCKDTASKAELQEYSTIIKDNTEQLLELLERSIDVNNAKSLDPPLSRKTVGDIMEDLYHTHLVIIPHHLDFIFKKGPELKVMTNRSFFLQIVSNLLSNAIKFTEQGSITMGWEKREDNAVIFIEDTGSGIPEDKLEDIFEAYYKTDSTSAGAGIGLQLCRQLAHLMGAEIKASSSLGRGSRFEFIIPLIK